MPLSVEASVAPSLPRELQVEVTGACNLRCEMCLVRYRPPVNRLAGSMPMERFRALIDANPNLEQITLQGLGEPLLAPNLFDMIEYATARSIRVGFNTNGTILCRDRAEQLVAVGLDWLYVSVDGATAATYEAIRSGANFQRVARNIRGLTEVKREHGTDRPHIRLVFVAMRKNVAELAALVGLAHEWGVDEVWVQNLSHSFSDTDPAGDYAGIRAFTAREALWADEDAAVGEAFAAARRAAEDLGIVLRLPRLSEPPVEPRASGEPGCDWPWRSAYVTHDGIVQPCCMVMGSDRADLGKLNGDGQSFAEIWRADPYRRFREALCSDEPPDVCRGCSMYRRTF